MTQSCVLFCNFCSFLVKYWTFLPPLVLEWGCDTQKSVTSHSRKQCETKFTRGSQNVRKPLPCVLLHNKQPQWHTHTHTHIHGQKCVQRCEPPACWPTKTMWVWFRGEEMAAFNYVRGNERQKKESIEEKIRKEELRKKKETKIWMHVQQCVVVFVILCPNSNKNSVLIAHQNPGGKKTRAKVPDSTARWGQSCVNAAGTGCLCFVYIKKCVRSCDSPACVCLSKSTRRLLLIYY